MPMSTRRICPSLSSLGAQVLASPLKRRHSGLLHCWSGWPDLNRRPHGPKPCALPLRYTPFFEIIFPPPMTVKNRMPHFRVRGHAIGMYLELARGVEVIRACRAQDHEKPQDIAGIRGVPASCRAEPDCEVAGRPQGKGLPGFAWCRFEIRRINLSWRISPALWHVPPR